MCKTVLDLQGPVYQTKEVFHSVQCNSVIIRYTGHRDSQNAHL